MNKRKAPVALTIAAAATAAASVESVRIGAKNRISASVSEARHLPGALRPATAAFQAKKETCAPQTVIESMKDTIPDWNTSLEHEFSNLAAKLALDEDLTENEQYRFYLLQQKRRQLKNPPSVEERLYEVRRAEIIEKTANVLKEYVHFFQSQGVSQEQA
jgi:hypothetical protein